jgi:hypothetical protein
MTYLSFVLPSWRSPLLYTDFSLFSVICLDLLSAPLLQDRLPSIMTAALTSPDGMLALIRTVVCVHSTCRKGISRFATTGRSDPS